MNNINILRFWLETRNDQGGGGGSTTNNENDKEEDCWQQCVEQCPGPLRAVCETHRFENLQVTILLIVFFFSN